MPLRVGETRKSGEVPATSTSKWPTVQPLPTARKPLPPVTRGFAPLPKRATRPGPAAFDSAGIPEARKLSPARNRQRVLRVAAPHAASAESKPPLARRRDHAVLRRGRAPDTPRSRRRRAFRSSRCNRCSPPRTRCSDRRRRPARSRCCSGPPDSRRSASPGRCPASRRDVPRSRRARGCGSARSRPRCRPPDRRSSTRRPVRERAARRPGRRWRSTRCRSRRSAPRRARRRPRPGAASR